MNVVRVERAYKDDERRLAIERLCTFVHTSYTTLPGYAGPEHMETIDSSHSSLSAVTSNVFTLKTQTLMSPEDRSLLRLWVTKLNHSMVYIHHSNVELTSKQKQLSSAIWLPIIASSMVFSLLLAPSLLRSVASCDGFLARFNWPWVNPRGSNNARELSSPHLRRSSSSDHNITDCNAV